VTRYQNAQITTDALSGAPGSMVYQKPIFADMGRQRKTDWMRWLGGLQCEANGSEKVSLAEFASLGADGDRSKFRDCELSV